MKERKVRIETSCVQGGYSPANGEPRQIPIIQSTTFKYDTSADMGKLFDLEAEGYFYTRLQNPTSDAVAAAEKILDGETYKVIKMMFDRYDENNEELSVIPHEIDRLNGEFRNLTADKNLFAVCGEYIKSTPKDFIK